MEIVPLTHLHAPTAARLHIAGQPGTFLTSLGQDVLTVLYQALPQSPVGFGFAACPTETLANAGQPALPSPAPHGFVSATTSIGKLLFEMGTQRFFQFLPPLLKRYAQQPRLAFRSVQTVLYPFLTSSSLTSSSHGSADTGTTDSHTATSPNGELVTAELLSIMVEPERRSMGIGARLLEQLVEECRARQIALLDVTVDVANSGAQRFYYHHGFAHHHDFTLYGRAMCSLRRNLQ